MAWGNGLGEWPGRINQGVINWVMSWVMAWEMAGGMAWGIDQGNCLRGTTLGDGLEERPE
jgi:hypothetical protein